MEAKVIIAIVVIVALIGHYWLYKWIKFKIDEGMVLKFLRDAAGTNPETRHTAQDMAEALLLPPDRVRAVCTRSPEIIATQDSPDTWSLKR
ncbi:hypothetical protein [Pseudomonas sp.]|uniref:hypothetical protein n=1 Tax=Pseudomonas sp. TaxID=306 RepID=UPI00257A963A|nr:hypothetical protein [Pseudomonas sp.]